MKIVWSAEAVEDLVSLRAYIAEDSPAIAQRTVRLIIESIEQVLRRITILSMKEEPAAEVEPKRPSDLVSIT